LIFGMSAFDFCDLVGRDFRKLKPILEK